MYNFVLKFWFEEIDEKQWWVKDEAFDSLIQSRFGKTHYQANKGELFSWRQSPQGRLAEIIVLDQFSRNMYRDTPLAFASDSLALVLAQEAINLEVHKELTPQQRSFLLMPFMHSESAIIHEVALTLFKDTNNLDFEIKHTNIIDRFGRYPHRNSILGRESTRDELDFLQQPGSSF